MFAITQTEYYLTLLKYIGFALGTTLFTVSFFAIIVTIVAYARYYK